VKYDNQGNYVYSTIQLAYGRAGAAAGTDDNRAFQVFAKDSYVWVLGTGSPNGQSSQIWLTKLNQADGLILYQSEFVTGGPQVYLAQSMLDSNNLIYVAGTTTGSIGGSHTSTGANYPGFTNAGNHDGFITVFDAVTGDRLTTMAQQTGGDDSTLGVFVDGTGLVYVSGSTTSSMNGQPFIPSSSYPANTFLLVYSLPSFSLLWTRQYGASSAGQQIIADGLGGIYQFQTTAIYCPYYCNGVCMPFYGDRDNINAVTCLAQPNSIILNKFDINGNVIWSKSLPGVPERITLDSNGVVMMSGIFQTNFESTPSYGSYDGFIRKSTLNYNCSCTDLGSLVTDLQQLLNIAPNFN